MNKLIKSHEWNDFFDMRIDNDISAQTGQNTIAISFSGSHYIHNVLFFGMKVNSIFYRVVDDYYKTNILLENAQFQLNSDTSHSQGGNIYIQWAPTFIQSKVCCSNCLSNSQGKHSCIAGKDDKGYKNIGNQCSFGQLSDSVGEGTLFNYYGVCEFNQFNITNSENNQYSCFNFYGINGDSNISLSNFKNCTSIKGASLYFVDYKGNTVNMSKCNIVEQICYQKTFGLICVQGYLHIESCIIKDNYANNSYLFFVYSGKGIYITYSYISNPRMDSFTNNPVSIQISSSKANEEDIRIDFNIISSCKERKLLQINLVDYETYIRNKEVSLSFYLSSAFLTIVHVQS